MLPMVRSQRGLNSDITNVMNQAILQEEAVSMLKKARHREWRVLKVRQQAV